jgi:hypothetical protein
MGQLMRTYRYLETFKSRDTTAAHGTYRSTLLQ